MRLSGIYTALITPFKEGQVDLEGLEILIQRQIDAGVNGVLVLGTTGETPTLSEDEYCAVLQTTVKLAKDKLTIIAGTGTNATASTIARTKLAEKLGADVALVITPYYNKPTQGGIFEHIQSVFQQTKIPICLYHIPTRTGVRMELNTILQLAEHSQVIGIKESSGDLNLVQKIMQNRPENFYVLAGDDTQTLLMMSLGAEGSMSIASNLLPAEMAKFVHTLQNGDLDQARELHYQLLPLFEVLFLETNPIPTKAALDFYGLPGGEPRLPLTVMSNKEPLHRVLQRYRLVETALL